MLKWAQGRHHAWEPRPLLEGLESMVVMATSSGRGRRGETPPRGWRGLRFSDARVSGDDVLDVGLVPPGCGGGLVRRLAGLASVHVGGVPVPPVVRRGRLLVGVVMLGGLVQQ